MGNLYEYIEKLVKENGYRNITEFCRAAEIPRATMSELKAGRTKHLSADTLSKIASFLNVSVDFLLGKDENARALESAREELQRSIIDNPSMPSGNRLEILFNISGYDHVIVCFNLGIDQCYLDNWMENNDLPPKPIIDKILGVFCIKPEDLLSSKELYDYNKQIGEWGLISEKTPTPVSESGRNVNIVKIAGRDGRYKEKRLSDEQIKALQTIIDQMPEAPDDL